MLYTIVFVQRSLCGWNENGKVLVVFFFLQVFIKPAFDINPMVGFCLGTGNGMVVVIIQHEFGRNTTGTKGMEPLQALRGRNSQVLEAQGHQGGSLDVLDITNG